MNAVALAIPREVAHQINPMIGQIGREDTLHNIKTGLMLVQHLTIPVGGFHMDDEGSSGLFDLLAAMHAAMNYELEREGEANE